MKHRKRGFTLVELLVVVAILAVLSTAAIIVLNPAEHLKQSRDAVRMNDLSALNKMINLVYSEDTSRSLGSSTAVYVSIPDASSTCSHLGLPALPTGFAYVCASTSTYRNVDGTGWLPFNFSAYSAGAPLAILPVDPVNTTSTGLYYMYVGNSGWLLTGTPESTKIKSSTSTTYKSIPGFSGILSFGSSYVLNPLYSSNGLVGYWSFDEGSGSTAADSSGNGNTGTLIGSPTWQTASSCKVNGCINFVSAGKYMDAGQGSSLTFPTGFSVSYWIKVPSTYTTWAAQVSKENYNANVGWFIFSGTISDIGYYGGTGTGWSNFGYGGGLPVNTWTHVVVTNSAGTTLIYLNGVYKSSTAYIYTDAAVNLLIGARHQNTGTSYTDSIQGASMDEVRIYNRALSAGEVSAIYNATK